MKGKIRASDVMVGPVIALGPEMSLEEAWSLLFEHRISGAPVVDKDGELLGVLSQTDLVREAFSDKFSDFPENSFYLGMPYYSGEAWERMPDKFSTMTVEEVMTRDPISAKEDEDIALLAGRMSRNHIHRIIITNGKKVTGIVSSLDLLKLLENQ